MLVLLFTDCTASAPTEPPSVATAAPTAEGRAVKCVVYPVGDGFWFRCSGTKSVYQGNLSVEDAKQNIAESFPGAIIRVDKVDCAGSDYTANRSYCNRGFEE